MKFRATAIEAFENKELGVITIHFDSEVEEYVQFQGASDGFEDDYYDSGFVYIEINDQLYSGYDCFSLVTLTKDTLLIHWISDKRMLDKVSEVFVSFSIGDDQLQDVVRLFQKAFRDCPDKLKIQTEQLG